ncbi:MAG: VIT domain-containing protein, partial [Armatimonadota bacterium]
MIPKRVIAVVFVVLLGLLVSGDWVQRLSRAEADMAENALLPVSEATEGQLRVVGKDGQPAGLCPLKTTRVTGNISGFMGRVDVVQVFTNPLKEKIEAIYVFPLPSGAAVDAMEMMVGTRKVVGEIKKREEARQIYENAKNAGQVASLLDQERPNIFTQSVANIMPGETVKVRISYIDTLNYDDGAYEFVFPMVVGPRFMPGAATG